MKNFCTISLLFFLSLFSFNTFATTYYLSSSSGSDNNSGTDASSPWRSIEKLNSFYNLRPGDNVLFKRGDVFYGGIKVNNSGSSGNPITYGAYGSGAKPIITGFTNITSWNNVGGNIWESSDPVSNLSYTNMVAVNGVNTAMGRYPNSTGPNTGYLYIKSHSGNSSITATDGFSSNWAGAGIVIRKAKYVIERGTISSQSGNTLYYSGASENNTQDGFGFFIQNDARTLDANGEWYYNPNTHKLRIYSSSRPNDVEIASVENLVSIACKSYISFDNISFQGSNSDVITTTSCGNSLTVQNCDIRFAGKSAVWTGVENSTIKNNTINDVNYIGVYSSQDNALIQSNTFNNINLFEGADQITASGGVISTYGQNTIVKYNQINNCGYSGIKLGGLNTSVVNNLVNKFCQIKEDGGGIDMSARDRARGSVIDGNIVLNGVGASNGTPDPTSNDFGGIFIDAYGTGITIINNTVANVVTAGIKLHGSNNITIRNNTTFNNGGSSWTKGGLMLLSVSDYLISNLKIEGNIFFAKTPEQLSFFAYPASGNMNDIFSFGDFGNNYYAKPIDQNSAILINHNDYNVSGWQSFSGKDGGSKGASKSISNLNDLRFEYNATSSSKTISLDANYIDVKNVSYNGSITLAPYSSAVLIRNGARTSNEPPVADAGSDRVIQLPSNSVTLAGGGTDPDGSVVSYAWNQVSGPSSATMVNTSSVQSKAGDLNEGTYVFRLTVTDNQGATGTSEIKITVKSQESVSEVNIPPVASVGDDRSIQFPKNSIVLPGSATDTDGSVASYSWSQISGPSSATLINTSSAQAGAGDLVVGTYIFQLKVTDDKGATGTSNLKIVVDGDGDQANIPPVASVGDDRTINLPKKSIVLPGSGSDEDGSIVSYSWKQLSGPSTAKMVNPASAQAGAGDLKTGTYVFQLTVTDDQGATGTANLNVTVNSDKPNTPPVVNVGSEREINLPKNSIFLPGSGSDSDGQVVSYSWKQLSGPSTATMINPSSAQAGAGDLKAGDYIFQLTATDDQGATGTATLNVRVNSDDPNTPPAANVGSDREINLPKNSIFLPGSGSDSDGQVVSYSWEQLSGPSTAKMVNPSSAQAGAGDLRAGNYVFQLTVTDDQGATGSALLNVRVNSKNQARIGDLNFKGTKDTAVQGTINSTTTYNRELAVSASELKVYPNPATNFINIEFDLENVSSNAEITITDMSGSQVFRKSISAGANIQQVNVSNLNKGTYIISIHGKQVQSTKFLKL